MAVSESLKTVNMHEAKTHLSRLVEGAAKGESFIIAKAGKPMVRVTALEPVAPVEPKKFGPRLDFGKTKFVMPEDFDRFAEDEILEMFGLND